MKTITKRLTLILLFLFIGQSCASNKHCFTTNKQKSKTTEKAHKQKRAKHTHPKDHADISLININSLEIAELRSQIQYLAEQLRTYEGPSNALAQKQLAYTQKIILNNGTTILGNVIYQDDSLVQVETMLGTLSLDRYSIIRVIDQEESAIEIQNKTLLELKGEATNINQTDKKSTTEVILIGEFMETKDDFFNTLISGKVKNIGPKRADFAKVTLTIYKNQYDNTTTKDYTAFVQGSTVAFDHGAISNSSLYPDNIAEFSVLIPSDFGPFLSYSYRVDWEVYE